MLRSCMLSQMTSGCALVADIGAKQGALVAETVAMQIGSIAHLCWAQPQSETLCHAQETMQVLASAQASSIPQAICSSLMLICRWHIEGEITHDWKKLAERKAKQLRKLSDTYKGQLDKVMLSRNMQSCSVHVCACCVHLHSPLHLHPYAASIFHAYLHVMHALTALFYHGSVLSWQRSIMAA